MVFSESSARTVKLVVRARLGDDNACTQLRNLCRRARQRMRVLCHTKGILNEDDIKHLLMVAFQKSLVTFTLDAKQTAFVSYFIRIATNSIRDISKLDRGLASLDTGNIQDPVTEGTAEIDNHVTFQQMLGATKRKSDKLIVLRLARTSDLEAEIAEIERELGPDKWRQAQKRIGKHIGRFVS